MTARVYIRCVVAPVLLGAALGAWGMGQARALSCDRGSYWSIEGLTLATADGPAPDASLWPDRGQLYPGRLELWRVPSGAVGAAGATVTVSVRYAP